MTARRLLMTHTFLFFPTFCPHWDPVIRLACFSIGSPVSVHRQAAFILSPPPSLKLTWFLVGHLLSKIEATSGHQASLPSLHFGPIVSELARPDLNSGERTLHNPVNTSVQPTSLIKRVGKLDMINSTAESIFVHWKWAISILKPSNFISVQEAINLLEPMTNDPVNYVRQGALIASALIMIQQSEVTCPKVGTSNTAVMQPFVELSCCIHLFCNRLCFF